MNKKITLDASQGQFIVKHQPKNIVPMTLNDYDNLIAKGEKVRVDSNAQLLIKGKLILNGVVMKFNEKDILSMKIRDKKHRGRIIELDDVS